jgi:membrane protease YdiL (CAAX protease family)
MFLHSLAGRVIVVIRAGVLASIITAVGAGVWTALLVSNLRISPAIPWAVAAMAVVLWLGWQYLGGRWWPQRTSTTRRAYLRARLVPGWAFRWALLTGVLSVVALAGLWIVLVEMTKAGGNPTLPAFSAYPRLTVALGILMGSLVSPLTEEAAFRGYCQVILEQRFRAGPSIFIASAYFALWHGPTQGLVWFRLLFYFLVGLVFGLLAYQAKSILPTVPAHILGDLTFFLFIWPHDAARPLIWKDGPDAWFWLAIIQMIVFAGLAMLAFRQLARATRRAALTR